MTDLKNLQIIVKAKFGSHLYGTATETSDTDYKGVYLPNVRDLILAKDIRTLDCGTGSNHTKNTKDDIDEQYIPLHDFGKLCARGDMVAFDLLHSDEKSWVTSTPLWEEIRGMRSKFYSKDIRGYIGYIARQVNKYGFKGSRVNQLQQAIAVLKNAQVSNSYPKLRIEACWALLKDVDDVTVIKNEKNGRLIELIIIAGKKFAPDTPVSLCLECLEKEFSLVGVRAMEASKNENVDWKAVSHAFRVLCQCEQLLTKNDITFPLPEAEYLKDIKAGKIPYNVLSEQLEDRRDEVLGKLEMHPTFPEKVDLTFWDDFIYRIYTTQSRS